MVDPKNIALSSLNEKNSAGHIIISRLLMNKIFINEVFTKNHYTKILDDKKLKFSIKYFFNQYEDEILAIKYRNCDLILNSSKISIDFTKKDFSVYFTKDHFKYIYPIIYDICL